MYICTHQYINIHTSTYIYVHNSVAFVCVCACMRVSRSQPWMQREWLYLSLEFLPAVR